MEYINKIRPTTLSSRRGIKRCPCCGELNGQRAKICRNEECELRRKTLERQHPFDPVKLVTYIENVSMFSLLKKERDVQPRNRNFVHIKEETLVHEENSTIVSQSSICYVDSCKYDPCSAVNISCKHVQACTVIDSKKQPLPQAEVYKVQREVLWNLNIGVEQKKYLWNMYKEDEQQIPAVQQLNSASFAVKCNLSKIFPAGRLHVTVMSNSYPTKKERHGCACKKLKIIVEPDNSVVMQEEICDHLLLVLAAILSKPNGKNLYENFTNSLKSFWMPTTLEMPLCAGDVAQDDVFYDLSIGGNFGEGDDKAKATDDIFIFGDEFLTDNNNIPDFSDIILDITSDNTNNMQSSQLTSTSNDIVATSDFFYQSDPNLVSSCEITGEYEDLRMTDMMTTNLELSDCNIELMDQFQLTDQIDLCTDDDIALPSAETSKLFDGNNISILSSHSIGHNKPAIDSQTYLQSQALTVKTFSSNNSTIPAAGIAAQQYTQNNNASLLKTKQSLLPQLNISETIEMPTIAVVKKCAVKASAIVSEIKTRKLTSPYIPAKRALIINSPHKEEKDRSDGFCGGRNPPNRQEDHEENLGASEPALAYSAWLEYVIESINESIDIVAKTDVVHNFHTHEEIFAHFSKSFSVGSKRRLPNSTTIIKTGRYKSHIKYVWYFTTASTVRRIFATKSSCIEIERGFEKNPNDDGFVPYVRTKADDDNTKYKRIYPKVSLYFAYIRFECCNNGNRKTGLKLEWLPNAFPKSRYGILSIEFSLGIKSP